MGENAAAGLFEMVVVDGVVNGYAIAGFDCVAAMVGDYAAAGFWAMVGDSAAVGFDCVAAAAGYVAMVRDRAVEEIGCVVAMLVTQWSSSIHVSFSTL